MYQSYLFLLELLKIEQEAERQIIWPLSSLYSGDKRASLLLRLCSKLSFLIKLKDSAGSNDHKQVLSYVAIGSECCGTSCDALSVSSILSSFYSPLLYGH